MKFSPDAEMCGYTSMFKHSEKSVLRLEVVGSKSLAPSINTHRPILINFFSTLRRYGLG